MAMMCCILTKKQNLARAISNCPCYCVNYVCFNVFVGGCISGAWVNVNVNVKFDKK